tara:strand:+ start:1186 stop:1584 length:399 start_codon:yes stop_codon:yes gene_type:complete
MHNTHKRGAVSEYQAATWFSQQGWEVYWSNLGQSSVDFIIAKDGEVKTIQVKSAVYVAPIKNSPALLRANLQYGQAKGKRYRDNSFDLLAICAKDGRIWVIPYDELPFTQSIRIWNANRDTGYEKWLVTSQT